ncbi:MAG: class I SAM-dependent methyltransferase [Cytophagaceae bacterium]|nr:class I SAM-dependent methyltransferase [Cytophagaceae bacterium]MDW8456452.1 class I SAM-dependent methyltransferase [Cytophagaceae bacterium]
MKLLKPNNFSEYQLIDSGNYMKLERYGSYILSRPEPQAAWDMNLNEKEWNKLCTAIFKKDKINTEKGEWVLKADMPEQWRIRYNSSEYAITFRLGLTSFKHIGIFPEQAPNWDYIYQQTSKIKDAELLNLFAYTGGASMAAAKAGAFVTHLDSVKPVLNWAKQNMELNDIKNIRWMAEDAMKFVKREVKRGNKYNAILLDPPAYGRGPQGEKWVLEDQLNELLKLCKLILKEENSFFVLNSYSMGYSALILESLIKNIFGNVPTLEVGELYVEDEAERKLPLSVFARFYC